MKKIIMFFLIVLLIFSLVACNQSVPNNTVEVDIGQSSRFTEEEINKAIDCIKNDFDFPSSTLTKISYNEEKSNSFIESYLEYGKGSANGVNPENVIVLLSDFYVDASSNNPVLTADSTYTDYNWILIRDDSKSNWIIDDFGY